MAGFQVTLYGRFWVSPEEYNKGIVELTKAQHGAGRHESEFT